MLIWNELDTAAQREALGRPVLKNSSVLKQTVSEILADVEAEGDEAVLGFTRKFDCPGLTSLLLNCDQRDALASRVSDEVAQAINTAFTNIKRFHEAQQPEDVVMTTSPGVTCEQRFVALESVGLYIPGGTAPLPSTALMLGVPAMVAGVPRKVLCTPPSADGTIAPEIAFVAKRCGIDEIYLCGGAQAIAAMALGTGSIAQVDKIFGPGNSFVTEAKQQVSLRPDGAAIDMPAGPSEVLVLADKNANPAFVASDLLSQAEHGTDSQSILVSDSKTLIEQTQAEVEKQLSALSRNEITVLSMENARYILTDDLNSAIEVSNRYAPEHLIVQVAEPRQAMSRIKHAGSVFLGPWSPESAGDYASGTNHVLPTYGYAKNYSSLGLLDFMRRYTVQELTEDGLRQLGPQIMTLAAAEGLDAHEKAVGLRLKVLQESDNE